MMRLKHRSKVLMIIMSLIIIFNTFSRVSIEAHAEEYSGLTRVKNSIALWSEKTTLSSTNSDEFTQDDIWVMGVLLSNLYQPWSTVLFENGGTPSPNSQTQQNMVDALTENFACDSGVATSVVGYVTSQSVATAKQLYIDVGDDTEKPASWGTVFHVFFDNRFNEELQNEGIAVVKLYWKDDDGEKHTVFRHSVKRMDECDVAMQLCYKDYGTDISKGIGLALFGTPTDYDVSADSSDLDTLNEQLKTKGKTLSDVFVYKSNMYVDTYGNLLCDNGWGRVFVVLPACMNPYTYVKDGHAAGDSLPLLSLRCFAEADNGTLIYKGDTATTPSVDKIGIAARSTDAYNLFVTESNKTALFRGATSTTDKAKLFESSTIQDCFNDYSESEYNIISKSAAGNFRKNPIFAIKKGAGSKWEALSCSAPTDKVNYTHYEAIKQVSVIQDFILFDSYGLGNGGYAFSSEAVPGMVRSETGIFNSKWEGYGVSNAMEGSATSNSTYFTTEALDADSANGFNVITTDYYRGFLTGLLASYIFAYYKSLENSSNETGTETPVESTGGTVTESDSGKVVGLYEKVFYTFNLDGLPKIQDLKFKIVASDEVADEQMMIKWLYYVLHPTQGIEYIRNLIKKFTTTFILDTHERIVGNTATNNTTGSVKYLSFSSYVATPNLNDMEWSKTFLSWFTAVYSYFIIAMMIILICHVMIGNMTWQRALIGIFLFALVAYLPPTVMNFSINTSNKISDKLYGNKFTYWAVVQHQGYMDEITTALEEGSNSDILAVQFKNYLQDTAINSTVVTLKWQAPKKYITTKGLSNYLKEQGVSNFLSSVLVAGVQDQTDGQTKVKGVDSYIYRSYTDLALINYKMNSWMSHGGSGHISPTENWDGVKTSRGTNLGNMVSTGGYLKGSDKEYYLTKAQNNGFNYNGGSNNASNYNYQSRILELTASKDVANALKRGLKRISLLNVNDVGLPGKKTEVGLTDISMRPTAANSELSSFGRLAYFNYTESPFFYLANNLNDQLQQSKLTRVVSRETADSGYKGMFLEEDGDYFYNNILSDGISGYGELRDFMDMRSMFYLVIPFLKKGNDAVTEFDEKYGFFLYDDVEVDFSDPDPTTIQGLGYDTDSEYYYKWWHNVMVSNLNAIYCPWVDLMYGCDYAKPETIYVTGEKYVVEDPLDPYSYFEEASDGTIKAGRYMVFSESEMKYYGLTEEELTAVEKRIIKLNRQVYSDLIQVLDYYTFDENVINTMAAMIETFAFNSAFSEHKLFSSNITLYPQAFELKNFTYDAYLRLILSEATGESLQQTSAAGVSKSLYATILENTSFLTGIVMIVVDFVTMYVIPVMKLAFILLIIILSFLIICTAVLNIEISLPTVLIDSLLKPLGGFMAISIGMATVISMFMSDGNTAVTNRKTFVISLGEPTMTLIIMLVVNILAVVLLGIIVVGLIKDTWKYLQIVYEAIKGAILGVVKGIIGGTIAKLTGRLNRSETSSAAYAVANSTGVSASRTLTANTVRVKNIKQETRNDNRRTNYKNISNTYHTNTQNTKNNTYNTKNTTNNTTTNVNNTTNNNNTGRTRVNTSGSRVNKTRR